MVSKKLLFALLLFSSLQTGCAIIDAGNNLFQFSWNAVKPRPTDYKNPTDDDGSEWDFVGQDGRGDRAKEYDPDRWWKKYVSSPKANAIERNVGVN